MALANIKESVKNLNFDYLKWYLEFLTLEKAPDDVVEASSKLAVLMGMSPVNDSSPIFAYHYLHDLVMSISLDIHGRKLKTEGAKGVGTSRYILLRNTEFDDNDVKWLGGGMIRPYRASGYIDRLKPIPSSGLILATMYTFIFKTTGNENLIGMANNVWQASYVPSRTANKAASSMRFWESRVYKPGEYIIPRRFESIACKLGSSEDVSKERYFYLLSGIFRPLTNPSGNNKNIEESLIEMAYIKNELKDIECMKY